MFNLQMQLKLVFKWNGVTKVNLKLLTTTSRQSIVLINLPNIMHFIHEVLVVYQLTEAC